MYTESAGWYCGSDVHTPTHSLWVPVVLSTGTTLPLKYKGGSSSVSEGQVAYTTLHAFGKLFDVNTYSVVMIKQVVYSMALLSVALVYSRDSVNLLFPVISLQAVTAVDAKAKNALFVAVSVVLLVRHPGISIVPHLLTGLCMCV